MDTDALVTRLRDEILNRPADDDLFVDPGDFYTALSRAEEFWYRQVATHYPDLIRQTSPAIASVDGGRTYTLTDDHYGEVEVWAPPGPPRGFIISLQVPESRRFGYYVQGRNIVLTLTRDYSPGVYVRWVPATLVALGAVNDPILPTYFEDAYLYQAAFYMASKPGFLGDPQFYRQQAVTEWEGDSVSDSGLLGLLKRQAAHGSHVTLGDQISPWYHNIPGST